MAEKIQYIARISHGKDSLKMLDVIVTRGFQLDRITTTDVWATDTIRGKGDVQHIAEEIADVQIMLDQLMIMHDCEEAVDEFKFAKFIRLWKDLEGKT